MLVSILSALLATTTAAAPAKAPSGLDALAWFAGDWQCTGRFADGRTIRSHESFDMALDGHWLRMRHDDVAPGRYRAEEWWGPAPGAKGYIVTVFDNGGGLRHYASAGWNGDALALENTAGTGYIDRFDFRRLDAATYQVDYSHRDKAGAWRTGDTLRCTKPATPPR
ncbi:hypothetical protein [Rhodanobacter sp. DHB23]|uniref:hypothetical protein n=1 Tax=Rhodanobacter sp. DHB23 TaxID=2775923 RepID=UPI00177B80ED|nr:hypothetical protein [Rhodanobacter sp. DHB23]MBD8874606.1 hypothetical protein [Rhodanobacter sp. DHB23]